MGISVVLAGLVMAIGGIDGCELLSPFHDVAVQARFLVLDDDRCGEVHGRYQGETFLNAAFSNDAFDVIGNGDDVFTFLSIESEIRGMGCA